MLLYCLLLWILISLVAGSNLSDEQDRPFSSISLLERNCVIETFKNAFTAACKVIISETEVSGNCALLDSVDVAYQTSKIDFDGLVDFLPENWFDSREVIKKVVHLRRANVLDEEIIESAKELTVFLIHVDFGGFKLKNNLMPVCFEFIVRAAPVNKFYDLFLESRFTYLTGRQKLTVLNALLENFDPDECKFFSAIVVTESDGFGTPFFASWYQKLSDCNFEGQEIRRHLAKLTSSLLASKLERSEEYFTLLRLCLRRVSIPLVMSFDRFHRLYYRTLQALPISTLECLMDRFIDAEVVENVPENLRIAYGHYLSIFSNRHKNYFASRSAALPLEGATTLTALLSEAQIANNFVNSESSFIQSLTAPISAWSSLTMQRAADGLDYIAKNFRGVLELAVPLSQAISKVSTVLLVDLTSNWTVPSNDKLIVYTKLIFSILNIGIYMIHVTLSFGNDCIELLNSFNTHLWPKIENMTEKERLQIRSFYPSALASIEFVAKNALFTDDSLAIQVIYSIIFNLSETPTQDLNLIVYLALKLDIISFFETALKFLSDKTGFDASIFLCCLLEKLADIKTCDKIEREFLKRDVVLFIRRVKSVSSTEKELLKILASEFL